MTNIQDKETGLLYQTKEMSADYRGVSVLVEEACYPDEAVNKRQLDATETRLTTLIESIGKGIGQEDLAKGLQPIKDAIAALKDKCSGNVDDSGLLSRIEQLESKISQLINAGVGIITIVNEGVTLRYYNLGLNDRDPVYTTHQFCHRKIVETSIDVNLRLGKANYTPVGMRRIKNGQFVESMNLFANTANGDNICLFVQGREPYPLGEIQLVVMVDGEIDTLDGGIVLPPELIQQLERETGRSFQSSVMELPIASPVVPDSTPVARMDVQSIGSEINTARTSVEKVMGSEIHTPDGKIEIDQAGTVIWHFGPVAFCNGFGKTEICFAAGSLYADDGTNCEETSLNPIVWKPIDRETYNIAREMATEIARPTIAEY